MANLFKSLISRGDDDEELDLEFDINSSEADCFELPPDRRDNDFVNITLHNFLKKFEFF